MTKPKPNKSTWPEWFPYPSSWLKAFILALFLGIIIRIISFTGNIGYKMANFANSPELFMIVTILVIILPIFIITFTHHIFHIFIKKLFPKIQSPEMQNVQGYIPTIVSIWEGLYGWLVICLSSLIASLLTIFLSPISDINFYETTKFYRDYESYQETILTILGLTWITTGALIYQVDFLFKRRLLSISLTNTIPNQESQIDHVKVEPNNLKGDNDFTQMKESKKSSITSPISSISQQKNKFEEAMNLAKRAAQITRIAKSKAEWYQSSIAWEKVIEMMKKVPISDPNYEAAQQKIIDYQKYINYAQKAVNSQNIN
ncbi:hypothetical protein [Anabaena sp. UHCC 0204]|uniref:hypothetical protein n=1 Tax=Anabaena sp. UHCC 0204 TaxID=2590009 RepID=UPI0014472D66|nr:hypothetical protein [Anabaena sp. UHCC 0204]MTJ06517.1 hypothetical protein [Anabaena sp. UHCC 0204]